MFKEEDPGVQLHLITAIVQCFLKNPEETQDMESDNPDLHDCSFIYWWLLSTNPEEAKMVVLGDKPVIESNMYKLEPNLLNILIIQIATLSSVYHKLPEAFVVCAHDRGLAADMSNLLEGIDDYEEYKDKNGIDEGGEGGIDLLDMGGMNINKPK
eukprot:10764534-Ditylum_brightwellii.AAC.1